MQTKALLTTNLLTLSKQRTMASFSGTATTLILVILTIVSSLICNVQGQSLSANFYESSCPNLRAIVCSEMEQAVKKEARMGASILRLFYHDCFVNVCFTHIFYDQVSNNYTLYKQAVANHGTISCK